MEKIKMYILNNKKFIVLCVVIVLIFVITGGYIYYVNYLKKDNINDLTLNESDINDLVIIENESLEKNENVSDEVDEYIFVDIKGYVNKPGVYRFLKNDDKRIYDLIDSAGGLKKDADTSIINMSLKLRDEMVIIVYSKKEISSFLDTKKDLENKLEICEKDEVTNDGCLDNSDINADKDTIVEENINSKVNINTASKEELTSLTGIGESKADDIIKYRNEVGLFTKIEDIMNIKGIGDSVFEKIKDRITIE